LKWNESDRDLGIMVWSKMSHWIVRDIGGS
jgi:hypothetical protein